MGKKKKNRRRDNVGNYTRLDGHVHIYMRDNPLAGGDGGMELTTAIANAKANGVTHMITVMHDSLGGFVDYVKQHGLNPNAVFHEIDGVQVSFGAEVTCRDFQNLNVKVCTNFKCGIENYIQEYYIPKLFICQYVLRNYLRR
jgi:hypothetical protein